MDFLKRHWWWVVTIAITLVLSGGAIAAMVVYRGQTERSETVLKKSMEAVSAKKVPAWYNQGVVDLANEAEKYRERQIQAIQGYIKQEGAWPVLVPGIFPRYSDQSQVFDFKTRYLAAIRDFMTTLNAVEPEKLTGAPPQATMFVRENAFYVAPWIPERTLPEPKVIIQNLIYSQEDLWLQQDIVSAVKATNDLYFDAAKLPPEDRTLANAVVKTIKEIRIGSAYDLVQRTGRPFSSAYGSASARYRYVSGGAAASGGLAIPAMGDTTTSEFPEAAGVVAPTVTGHATNNNAARYKVLPFTMIVIVDAGNFAELLRELSGTRSFITVENIDYRIIPETENSYRQYLAITDPAMRLRVYGNRPLAQLTITGESLLFQVPGGRPTVEPKPAATDAATMNP